MLPTFTFILLVFALCHAPLSHATPDPRKLATRDFSEVYSEQSTILAALQDQVQEILPELWQLGFSSGDPSSQIAKIQALYQATSPAIRNTTLDGIVPPSTTFIQTAEEWQVGMRLIRPILDIVIPLGRFERTDTFMALMPSLASAFNGLLQSVAGTWDDHSFVSGVATGLVARQELDSLTDLNMFSVVVNLGLTA